jgi:hypothetical protein
MAKITALSTIKGYQVIKYDDPSKPLRQHREELIEELFKKLNVFLVYVHGRQQPELKKLDGEDESVRNLRQYAWNLYINNIKRFKNVMEIDGWVNPYIDIEYETQVIARVLIALDNPQNTDNHAQLTLLAKSMPGHTPDELRLKRNIFAILAVAASCCVLASLFTFTAALIGPPPMALLVAGIYLTIVSELVAIDSAKRAADKESFTTNLSLFSNNHAKMVDSQANSAENEEGSTEEDATLTNEEDPILKTLGF